MELMQDRAPQAAATLEIEEDLSLVERLKLYHQSNAPVQRLVHVQEMGVCAEAIGAQQTMAELIPLLQPVSEDPELSVRQALAEQITRLSKVLLADSDLSFTYEAEEGSKPLTTTAYRVVIEQCVPLLTGMLSSSSGQDNSAGSGTQTLTDAASEALVEMAGLLKSEDIGKTILTSVLRLAHHNDAEESRVIATQLIGSLAPVVTHDLCCEFLLPEIVSLADDPAFRVRKAAALQIGQVCRVAGEELTLAQLLSVFETLARDEIWGVRKASVESLADVAAVVPVDVRSGKLVPLLQELYEDNSRWVRITTCQALGPFMSTLPSAAISAELLGLFTELAKPSNPAASDSDIAYYCAYNLPALLKAVGADRWPELSEAFRILVGNLQWKVRRTLSFALHELAAILGPKLTEEELLSTFERFLKDLDEVKVGVIGSLCSFLSSLSPPVRMQYLGAIVEIRAETDNWRHRHILAQQLAAIGAIFPREAATEKLVPLALELCTDPVAEVRAAAVEQVGKLLSPLLAGESPRAPQISAFLQTVCGMATMRSCHQRINCVHICISLVQFLHESVVRELLLPQLVQLSRDPVPNVRLALARLLMTGLLPRQEYAQLPEVSTMVEALRADADRDVLRAVNGPEFEPPRYRSKPLQLLSTTQSPSAQGSAEGHSGDSAGTDGDGGDGRAAPKSSSEEHGDFSVAVEWSTAGNGAGPGMGVRFDPGAHAPLLELDSRLQLTPRPSANEAGGQGAVPESMAPVGTAHKSDLVAEAVAQEGQQMEDASAQQDNDAQLAHMMRDRTQLNEAERHPAQPSRPLARQNTPRPDIPLSALADAANKDLYTVDGESDASRPEL